MSDKSDFTIIRYTPAMEEEWEEFLASSANGTIFHSQRFMAYHPPGRFKHHHLFFRLRGKIRALFTGAEVEGEGGRELRSHPGASFGGFVVKTGADFEDCFGMVDALLDYARGEGFKSVRLTQTPIIYHLHQHQGIEFALTAHGFNPEWVELTQSVDLTGVGDDPFAFLVDKTRNACRQAIKNGLIYQEAVELNEKDIADFYHILVENRRTLGVTPTHTEAELMALSRLIPENLHLSFVEYRGKRIAGLLHFACNRKVVLLFYICHLREYQALKPAPFLLANTLNWAKGEGFKELDFGISTVKGVPTRGLLKFKENFRARPFLRTTYSIAVE